MDPRLELTHPELVRRFGALVERAWARGWDVYVISATRSEAQQRWMYGEYLAGRFPNIVADPDRVYGPAPDELGGWVARGSMHMPQADGWSHALDIGWVGPRPGEVHELAYTVGLRFPEPTENWHMEWWGPWQGVFPILDPTAEAGMTKEELAAAIGAVIAPADHVFAGLICTPLLDHVIRDEDGNVTEQVMALYPLAQAQTYTHQELKLARLTRPGNTETQ